MIFLKNKTKTKTKLTACLFQVVEKDSVRKGCWLRAYFTFCSLFSWGSRLFSSAGELKKKKHHGLSSGSHCCSTRYSRAQVTNHILTEMFQLFIARLVQYKLSSPMLPLAACNICSLWFILWGQLQTYFCVWNGAAHAWLILLVGKITEGVRFRKQLGNFELSQGSKHHEQILAATSKCHNLAVEWAWSGPTCRTYCWC